MLSWSDVGVVIRAVPGQRLASVAALVGQVEEFVPEHQISWHGPGRSVPESYADALASWDVTGVRWVLQFEDDAILAPGFGTHALRLLNEVCGRTDVGLVSFYSGRRVRPGESLPAEPVLEVLPGSRFLMAQAIALPALMVFDHNAFMLSRTAEWGRPLATDTATAAWLKARRLKLARSWPSLVQHRDVASLCGHHRNANRFSESFRISYGEP